MMEREREWRREGVRRQKKHIHPPPLSFLIPSPPSPSQSSTPLSIKSFSGARVHSDSWGTDATAYDDMAWDFDAFTHANPDFLPLIAAGNDGADGGDGSVTAFDGETLHDTAQVWGWWRTTRRGKRA